MLSGLCWKWRSLLHAGNGKRERERGREVKEEAVSVPRDRQKKGRNELPCYPKCFPYRLFVRSEGEEGYLCGPSFSRPRRQMRMEHTDTVYYAPSAPTRAFIQITETGGDPDRHFSSYKSSMSPLINIAFLSSPSLSGSREHHWQEGRDRQEIQR